MKLPLLLLLFSLLSARAEWPTFHGNYALSGVSRTNLPDQPQLLWRYQAENPVDSPVVSSKGALFFTTRKGKVVSLNKQGQLRWIKSFTRTTSAGNVLNERFESPLLWAHDTLYAAAVSGSIRALSPEKGELIWSSQLHGTFIGSPNATAELVCFLNQSEGQLFAFEPRSGKRVWQTIEIERSDGSPGIFNGKIAFGSCLSELHLFDTNGAVRATFPVGAESQIAGGVAMELNCAYAGTRDGSLICFDLKTKSIRWTASDATDQTFSTPAISGSLIIYSSDDSWVRALNKKEGTLAWSFETAGLPSSAVIAGDKVVVCADGMLYLLKLADGSKVWSRQISDEITAPSLINGAIVVGADDGTVSAWGTK